MLVEVLLSQAALLQAFGNTVEKKAYLIRLTTMKEGNGGEYCEHSESDGGKG